MQNSTLKKSFLVVVLTIVAGVILYFEIDTLPKIDEFYRFAER